MQLIERVELTSTAASITFSNIPQDGTDLYLLCSLRTTNGTGAWWDVIVKPNGSASNATSRVLYGDGSGATSLAESVIILRTSSNATTANTFGSASLYFPNYTSSANKSVSMDAVSENNSTSAYQGIHAHLWSITNAISSIVLEPSSGNLASGSSASLYKITKGSDGIVSVS